MVENLELRFPAVDPADLSSAYENILKMPVKSGPTSEDPRAYANWCKPGADMVAVWTRASILAGMHAQGLLNEWLHDGKLDDVFYRVVAEFPIDPINMQPGVDGRISFDQIIEGMLLRIRLS